MQIVDPSEGQEQKALSSYWNRTKDAVGGVGLGVQQERDFAGASVVCILHQLQQHTRAIRVLLDDVLQPVV